MPRVSVREVIVETAVTEFHRLGFSACSVDTITKAAGVPKGSFYNHFKSKEDLGAEAVARYTETAGWRSEHGKGPLGDLRARFEAMVEVVAGNGYTRGCLIGNMGEELADHSEVVRAQVRASLDGWSASIAQSIRDAQAAGELGADRDPERLGRFILNAFQGALLRAKVEKDAGPLDDFFTVVFDSMLA